MSASDLIKVLVFETLTEVSPEEIVLLDEYDPNSKLQGATARGPQGIGIEAVLFLLLPYLYKFFEKFLDCIASDAADYAYKIAKKWLEDNSTSSNEVVRELIKAQLIELGLPPDHIDKVTDVIYKIIQKNSKQIANQAK